MEATETTARMIRGAYYLLEQGAEAEGTRATLARSLKASAACNGLLLEDDPAGELTADDMGQLAVLFLEGAARSGTEDHAYYQAAANMLRGGPPPAPV
jgi:hypothetical protein